MSYGNVTLNQQHQDLDKIAKAEFASGCPRCRQQVVAEGGKCPVCGYEYKERSTKSLLIRFLIVTIILAIGGVAVYYLL